MDVIPYQTLFRMWLLIHAGIKVKTMLAKGARGNKAIEQST